MPEPTKPDVGPKLPTVLASLFAPNGNLTDDHQLYALAYTQAIRDIASRYSNPEDFSHDLRQQAQRMLELATLVDVTLTAGAGDPKDPSGSSGAS